MSTRDDLIRFYLKDEKNGVTNDIIDRILATGFPVNDVTRCDGITWTLLGFAVFRKKEECVRHLLSKGANPQQGVGLLDYTPLRLAARDNCAALCTLLVPLDRTSWRGAFSVAMNNGCNDAIDALLVAGRDLSFSNTHLQGAACRFLFLRRPYILEKLLFAGMGVPSTVEMENGEYRAPLHAAAELGAAHALVLLITHGYSPDVKDRAGRTPRMVAQEFGHTTCVKILDEAWRLVIASHGVPTDSS